jgi:hypothetical protein
VVRFVFLYQRTLVPPLLFFWKGTNGLKLTLMGAAAPAPRFSFLEYEGSLVLAHVATGWVGGLVNVGPVIRRYQILSILRNAHDASFADARD